MPNPLLTVQELGQSLWYDYIRRGLLASGELQRLIDEDGLRGVTSNPAIFEKAIAGSTDYDAALAALGASGDHDVKALYEALAIEDIRAAADVMRPVYERTNRRDGYVSLEVSPYLAYETEATLAEARRLWAAVDRPNVMIKVPATPAGIPAIRQLITEGINVNVTLLFAIPAYETVAEAFLAGLEARAAAGGDLGGVASVASFFVSRIDTAVDRWLDEQVNSITDPERRSLLQRLRGQVAIANAKLASQRCGQRFRGPRWEALAARGAQTQRLLWASTGTKDPAYRDVMYVEALIGPETVDTVPAATFDAFRDHGVARATLEENVPAAEATLAALERAGLSLREVTDRLLVDGVRIFAEAFDQLLAALQAKREGRLGAALDRQSLDLPSELDTAVQAGLEAWRAQGNVRRLWARDASLWTDTDEAKWMGWLDVADGPLAPPEPLRALSAAVAAEGFTDLLLLGMGGSSLFPEVLATTFGQLPGHPRLHVLDSTDPAQIRAVEGGVNLAQTLFIVSSKSGTTLEPNIFEQYFFARAAAMVGEREAPRRFVAITDPGSHLQQLAERKGFRAILFGIPSIGGRYSALSNFGMAPGALMGLDIPAFVDRAEEMVHSCAACVPPAANPGVILGMVMGVSENLGRDKVTIIASPGIRDFGAWLEQLLAESTGKDGKGLIPVDLEPLGPPAVYGRDRLFAYLRLESAPDAAQDAAVAALAAAGQPVVRISLRDPGELAEEVFRWEIATAVAGSLIGINPYNQPDVEASKIETRKLTDAYEQSGKLPPEAPFFTGDGVRLYGDGRNRRALEAAVGADRTLAGFLKAHLDRLRPGDYFAALAYVERNEAHQESLQALRQAVRDRKLVATCVGFGPRFLHSTGQAYKGGPNCGVFLQITADDAEDLPVPGQRYTFGIVKAAQARGDFEVLCQRGRRALRVHLGSDVAAGLRTLQAVAARVLGGE
jgi:transaldolase/glucose-6-phosphate isomerase